MKKKPIESNLLIVSALFFGFFICILLFIMQTILLPKLMVPTKIYQELIITPFEISSDQNNKPQSAAQDNFLQTATESQGVIGIGMQVIINNTGNDGLRMRENAGIDSVTKFLARDGEIYKIIDGPIILDGLIWWNIVNLDNESKTGWSVQDYMRVY